jgi:tRNA pseudouridine38-40 synthase
VQGEVEDAVVKVIRTERRHVQCAGRTDAGVHATGQVFHVDVPTAAYPGAEAMFRRLNAVLPDDVVVKTLSDAPEGFDARFSALSRTYEYLLQDGARDPMTRRFVHHHGYPVDVDLMHAVSQPLLGLRDFTSVCRTKENGTAVRELQQFDWARRADGVIAVTVTADAFCWSMVRMLVGAVLDVGQGRKDPEWLGEYIAGRDRSGKVFVAPAHGLTLVSVKYPADDMLLARQLQTKNTRDVDGSY